METSAYHESFLTET